ncbi:MAG: OprD family outer membrane porin [Elusimicrobiaceae bacterium]|nr:OprD family outer membrane porin [Elusimicrobiaceae bacterium]
MLLFSGTASADQFDLSEGAQFIRSGSVAGELRSYFMNRTFRAGSVQQANALGGNLTYETSAYQGLALGLALYTSQRLPFTPATACGTNLLGPGQESFAVLGQSYLKYRRGGTKLLLFRQEFNTPFMNRYDVKMVPVLYEAYTVENRSVAGLVLTGSFVTGIKTWNSTEFVSLPQAAGYTGVNRPAAMFGAVYSPGGSFSAQLWNYQVFDFLNTSYFQADRAFSPGPDWTFSLSAQAMGQTETGDAVAGRIKSAMFGVLGGARHGGLLFNAGYTQAAHGTNMVNPYASFPGYSSIMEEDCDLAGERAWVTHVDYDFSRAGAPGLLASYYHTQAFVAGGSFMSPHQFENNFIVKYSFAGRMQGLSVTGKAAYVTNSQSTGGVNYTDLRFITSYKF